MAIRHLAHDIVVAASAYQRATFDFDDAKQALTWQIQDDSLAPGAIAAYVEAGQRVSHTLIAMHEICRVLLQAIEQHANALNSGKE